MMLGSCSFPEVAVDGGVELIWSFEESESLELEAGDSVDVKVDTFPAEHLTETVCAFDTPAASFANSMAAVLYSSSRST